MLGRLSLRGNANRFVQRIPLFAAAERNGTPGSHRGRRRFALDLVSLRAPVCVARRDDLRSLAATVRDLVPHGAASDRRGYLRGRPDSRGRGTLPPPLLVPQPGVFHRRSASLVRPLRGDQPPTFVGEAIP